MNKEIIIRTDLSIENAEQLIKDLTKFLDGSDFVPKLFTEEIKSMSGLVYKVCFIKIIRKED